MWPQLLGLREFELDVDAEGGVLAYSSLRH
jgi:hypothetical protein